MKDAALLQTVKRSLLRNLSLLAALSLGLAAGGCSLIVDENGSQCEVDADCSAFGEAICSPDKVCVAASGAGCTTNTECAQRFGKDYVCVPAEGACKDLRSENCQTVVGTPAADDALIIGAIGPTSGVDEGIGVPIENAIRVAVGDFKDAAAALDDKPRPLVMVGCDDESSTEAAVAAAEHLVSVGSPAIIGAAFSGITLNVSDVTIPAGALLISPSATAVGIGSLVDNSLVWRTAPPDSYQAHAISLYIDDFLKAQVGAVPALKVAVLHRGDAYGAELGKTLEDEMILNGARPTDAVNNANYIRFDYGDPDDPQAHPPKLEEAVAAVLDLHPHIIVLAGFSEAVTDLFVPIEKDWAPPADPDPPPRPFYVMTDGVVGSALWDTIGDQNELRTRVTGTTPGRARSNPVFQAFASNYAESFTDAGGAEVFGAAEAFDAAYLIGYAAATIPEGPVTGQKLAQGIGKMVPPGSPIDAGPDGIAEALQLLRDGETLDFTGASGPLDFDLGKGEASADIQIWCLPAGLDGRAQSSTLSGLYLDAANDTQLQGSLGSVCD